MLFVVFKKKEKKSATLLGMTGEMAIVLLCVWNLKSYVRVWTPTTGEKLLCKMEPNNIKDNYAACVQKYGVIVEHLMLGKTGRFAKITFYFLRGFFTRIFYEDFLRICLLKKELVG